MTRHKPHTAGDHPTSDVSDKAREIAIDPLIHPLPRLKICAALNNSGAVRMPNGKEMAFGTLRNTVGLSDASLSKHLKALSDAGYVSMKKTASLSRSDSRRLTWVKLTSAGREAFDSHIAELHVIAHGHPEPTPSRPPLVTWSPTFGATPELG